MLGRQHLGLNDDEWRRCTPRLFYALLSKRNDIQSDAARMQLRLAAHVMAEIRNTTRGRSTDKVWIADDIFDWDSGSAVDESIRARTKAQHAVFRGRLKLLAAG